MVQIIKATTPSKNEPSFKARIIAHEIIQAQVDAQQIITQSEKKCVQALVQAKIDAKKIKKDAKKQKTTEITAQIFLNIIQLFNDRRTNLANAETQISSISQALLHKILGAHLTIKNEEVQQEIQLSIAQALNKRALQFELAMGRKEDIEKKHPMLIKKLEDLCALSFVESPSLDSELVRLVWDSGDIFCDESQVFKLLLDMVDH